MQGVDRHLLGLRLLAMVTGRSTPSIFKGEGWALDFMLTTSQV